MSTPVSCGCFFTTSGGIYSVVPQRFGGALTPFKWIDQLKSHNLTILSPNRTLSAYIILYIYILPSNLYEQYLYHVNILEPTQSNGNKGMLLPLLVFLSFSSK